MKNFLRRTVSAVMVTALIFSINTLPASAMTKKQVNAEITSINKEITSDRKKLKTAQENDWNLLQTYVYLSNATRYSTDPFIVKVDHGYNDYSFYYLSDPTGLNIKEGANRVATVDGLILVSTKTYDFYGTTCQVATVAEKPHSADDINADITKKSDRKTLLKRSKKESMTIAPTTQLVIGEQQKVSYSLKYGTEKAGITKITWKSSKPSVVKVSKNGTLTALKAGVATVTAKLSVTGRTYKTTVTVTAQ